MIRHVRLGPTTAIVGLTLLVGQAAMAQTCAVAAAGLSYGTYDPFAPLASTITGAVTVTCQATVALGLSYSIQLGTGTSGSFAARAMSAGANRLGYQLYTNAVRSAVWGDGTGGTAVVGDSFLLVALTATAKTYTVYGLVPAGQLVGPGAYSDVVNILVTY